MCTQQDVCEYQYCMPIAHGTQRQLLSQGERTLCVLTKLDKLRAGAEAGRAIAYLTNQRKPHQQ